MQEGLRVLIVGNDDGHNLDFIVDGFVAHGYTPQIVRMTEGEWKLRSVIGDLDCLSATYMSAVPAVRTLMERGRYPIDEGSEFTFDLCRLYAQLGDHTNTDAALPLAARQIISKYLHSSDNPLVAVVLSREALLWPEARKAWLQQIPSDVSVWRMDGNNGDKPSLVMTGAVALGVDSLADIS